MSIKLIEDRFNGIVLDASTLPASPAGCDKELAEIIPDVKGKRLIWVTLPIDQSDFIPVFTRHGFVFYDCNEQSITLLKKLAEDPVVPTPTNHTLGVGAVVMDDHFILVIKDRFYKKFRLPGGYIDARENVSQALLREVFEETGVRVEFEAIVSMGHFFPGQFGESNLYIVCRAKPLSREIHITDDKEIMEAKWMSLDDYFNSDEISVYNKEIEKNASTDNGFELKNNELFALKNIHHEFFFSR